MPNVGINFGSSGSDKLIKELRILSETISKNSVYGNDLSKSLKKTSDSASNLSKSFHELKSKAAAVFTAVAGMNALKAVGNFQKLLYDISRTSKLTGQSFTELRGSMDTMTKSTQLSRAEAATFIKTLQDQVKGAQLSGKAMSNLAKMLSDEFGPALKDVQGAMQTLMKIQQTDIFILEKLHKGMKPKEVIAYATSLVQLGKITDQEYRTLVRASGAFKGLHESMQDKRLRSFNDSLEKLTKSWENLKLTIGTPMIGALTSLFDALSGITKIGDDMVTSGTKMQKALSFVPLVAGALSLVAVLKSMNTLLGGPVGAIFKVGMSLAGIGNARAASGGGAAGAAAAAASASRGGGMGLGGTKLVRGAVPVFVVNQAMTAASQRKFANSVATSSAVQASAGRSRTGRSRTGRTSVPKPPGLARRLAGGLGKRALVGGAIAGGIGVAGQLASGALKSAGQEKLGAGVSAAGNVAAGTAMGASLGSLVGPIGTAIGGIAGALGGLLASLEDIKKAFPELTPLFEQFDGTLKILQTAFAPVVEAGMKFLKAFIEPVAKALTDLAPLFASIAASVGGALANAFVLILKLLTPIQKLVGVVLATALKIITPLFALLGVALKAVTEILEPLVDYVSSVFMEIANAIQSTLDGIFNMMPNWAKKLIGMTDNTRPSKEEAGKGKGEESTPTAATNEQLMKLTGSKTSDELSEFAREFSETLSKTQFGGRELTELTEEQVKKASAMLQAIKSVESIMGVDRGSKREFMAAAASLESMRDHLKNKGLNQEQMDESIKRAVQGRLTADVEMSTNIAKAGQNVTPENIQAAKGRFGSALGAENIDAATAAQDVQLFGVLKLGDAYKNAAQEAKSISDILQVSVGYNQKIADFMARYRGDSTGAVAQLEKNNQLFDIQSKSLQLAMKYRQMALETEGSVEEKVLAVSEAMKQQGYSETDIASATTSIGQELSGHLDLVNAINQVEVARTENYMQQDRALQSQYDLEGDRLGLLKSEMELTKALFLGLGPTLDMQIKSVEQLERMREETEKQIRLAQVQLNNDPANLTIQRHLIALQKRKVDLAKEELEITKNLREGYLNAMTAFTNVEGFFSKIVLKSEHGAGEMMREFGMSGGLKVGALGAGGTDPFMRWKQGGGVQFEGMEGFKKRAVGYDDQILPERGRVNPAEAARQGADYWGAKELQEQTGLPGTGQSTAGPSGKNIFDEIVAKNSKKSPLTAMFGAEGETQTEQMSATANKESNKDTEKAKALSNPIVSKLEEIRLLLEKGIICNGTSLEAVKYTSEAGKVSEVANAPAMTVETPEQMLQRELKKQEDLKAKYIGAQQRVTSAGDELANLPAGKSKTKNDLRAQLSTETKNMILFQNQFAESLKKSDELKKEVVELKNETKKDNDKKNKIEEDKKKIEQHAAVKADSEARDRLKSKDESDASIDKQYKQMEDAIQEREKVWKEYGQKWTPDEFMKGFDSSKMVPIGSRAGMIKPEEGAPAQKEKLGQNIFEAMRKVSAKANTAAGIANPNFGPSSGSRTGSSQRTGSGPDAVPAAAPGIQTDLEARISAMRKLAEYKELNEAERKSAAQADLEGSPELLRHRKQIAQIKQKVRQDLTVQDEEDYEVTSNDKAIGKQQQLEIEKYLQENIKSIDAVNKTVQKNVEATKDNGESFKESVQQQNNNKNPLGDAASQGRRRTEGGGVFRTGLDIPMGESASQFYDSIGGLFGPADGGSVKLGFASGGKVPGSGTGDSVLARLTPGEFVVNKNAAMQNKELLYALNAKGYAEGGPVVPPLSMSGGGGGFSPKFSINVRGDSVNKIMENVQGQLASILSKMMSSTGTTGRFHDLPQSG